MSEPVNNVEQIAVAAPSETVRRLVLASRVVAIADIARRLDDVRELVVPPGAVITPSVRDELRQRNITLVFSAQAPAQAVGAVRVALATAGTRFNADSLVSTLRGRSIAVEPRAMDCLLAAVDWLAAQIASPEVLGVLLTRFTAPAICLANRLPGIRAIRGSDVSGVAIDGAAVGANLLVADPDERGFFRLKQVVCEFCRGGVQSCPAVFAERLGRPGQVKP